MFLSIGFFLNHVKYSVNPYNHRIIIFYEQKVLAVLVFFLSIYSWGIQGEINIDEYISNNVSSYLLIF